MCASERLWFTFCIDLFCLSSANQPHLKLCMHAYLFPFPVSQRSQNATDYDSAISECLYLLTPCLLLDFTHHSDGYDITGWRCSCPVYRGVWSVFMLIGVAAVILGGFLIICAAPFASHRLYKAGGGLFLASGELLKRFSPAVKCWEVHP